ncbi:hypothetical protein BH11PLA2_BH11PLA2_48910 [soil metagenome]
MAIGGSWKGVSLFDTITREPLGTLDFPEHVLSLDISRDGEHLLAGGLSGTIRLWHLPTQAILATTKLQGSVETLAFSPDGCRFVAGGSDRQCSFFEMSADAADAKPIILSDIVEHLDWGTNGLLAITTADGSAGLWDVHTRRAVGPPLPVHAVLTRFAADGTTMLTASPQQGLTCWRVPTVQFHDR